VTIVHRFGQRIGDAGTNPDHRGLLDALERRIKIGSLTQKEADAEIYRIHCHMYGNEWAPAIHDDQPMNTDHPISPFPGLPEEQDPYYRAAIARYEETGDDRWAAAAGFWSDICWYEETGNPAHLKSAEEAMAHALRD
jgi:hypothetical protein